MKTDLAVVGGGLVGCAVAREARRRGLRVVVLERDTPGAEASGAAAGMLSAAVGSHEPGPLSELLLRASRFYPGFVAALEEETGIPVEYAETGTVYVSVSEDDEALLTQRYGWHAGAGLRTERLTREQVLELEPAVSPAARGGLRFPGDHQVDNRLLARAAWLAAAAAGAEFRLGAEATSLLRESGRAVGVRLAGGEEVRAEVVVLAGGCWSGLLRDLPRTLPVEPVRGQIVCLEQSPPLLRGVVDSPRCYAVPRRDGRLLLGSTAEWVGFRKGTNAAGVRGLLDAAMELAPGLADAPVRECWSGLRPWSSDEMPILGPEPDLPGLFYATGHGRHGILLAPLTAAMVARSIAGEEVEGLAEMSAARFGGPALPGRSALPGVL